MKNEIKSCWLWPDHVIGLRESREVREEHNALVNGHADLLAERDGLRAALRGLLALIDEGWLVRDITDDAKPGFAMRQLEPVRRLADARALVEGGKP